MGSFRKREKESDSYHCGSGKGSGAALMMFLLGIAGTLICLYFGQKLKQYHFEEHV